MEVNSRTTSLTAATLSFFSESIICQHCTFMSCRKSAHRKVLQCETFHNSVLKLPQIRLQTAAVPNADRHKTDLLRGFNG